MKSKTEKQFWTSDPMQAGGAIDGQYVHRNLFMDHDGMWEVVSATPTGRKDTLRHHCEGKIIMMPTAEYVVEMRLCTNEELDFFVQEEVLRN